MYIVVRNKIFYWNGLGWTQDLNQAHTFYSYDIADQIAKKYDGEVRPKS